MPNPSSQYGTLHPLYMSESPIISFAEVIVDMVHDAVLVLDGKFHVVTLNEPCSDLLELERDATLGRLIYDCGEGRWDIPELRSLLETTLPERDAVEEFVLELDSPKSGPVAFEINARRLDEHDLILMAIRRATGAETDAHDLRARNQALEARLRDLTSQIKELTRREARIEQQERRRISEILHDDIQQRIYGIGMRVGLARQDAEEGDKEKVLEDLANVETWLRESIEILRGLAVDLSPPPLKTERLVDTMEWLAGHMEQMHGLRVDVTASEPVTVPEETGLVLFQIVRELLFNVVKHANTEGATVEIREEEEGVTVLVNDEGAGFDKEAVEQERRTALGLVSLRRRLEGFGGKMHIDTTPGKGTRITIQIPHTSPR